MTNRHDVIFRILADLFVAFFVTLAFFAVSHSGNAAWLIGVIGAPLFAAGIAGYLEPSAKKVWIHPLVIMSPDLNALPVALLTCHGHGCTGMIAFLILANLFTLVLLAVSFTFSTSGASSCEPVGHKNTKPAVTRRLFWVS